MPGAGAGAHAGSVEPMVVVSGAVQLPLSPSDGSPREPIDTAFQMRFRYRRSSLLHSVSIVCVVLVRWMMVLPFPLNFLVFLFDMMVDMVRYLQLQDEQNQLSAPQTTNSNFSQTIATEHSYKQNNHGRHIGSGHTLYKSISDLKTHFFISHTVSL